MEGRKSYLTLCLFTLASLQSILSMPRHYICKHLARIEFPMYLSILELKEICTGFGRETISFHIVESKFHSLFLHIDATANKVYLARYITVFHSINPKTLCQTKRHSLLHHCKQCSEHILYPAKVSIFLCFISSTQKTLRDKKISLCVN